LERECYLKRGLQFEEREEGVKYPFLAITNGLSGAASPEESGFALAVPVMKEKQHSFDINF